MPCVLWQIPDTIEKQNISYQQLIFLSLLHHLNVSIVYIAIRKVREKEANPICCKYIHEWQIHCSFQKGWSSSSWIQSMPFLISYSELVRKSPKFNYSCWQANSFLTTALFMRHLVLQSWGFIHLNRMVRCNYSCQFLCTFNNTETTLHCEEDSINGIDSVLIGQACIC